jgi:DNA-binding CsgD family transcriptional regulator
MHRTIENLCIDIFRFEGRRPNLVLLDDVSGEIESTWVDSSDHSDVLVAAEDAAIVRKALAMLSPAERAALVMWEIDGRSTADIAAELGIKESTVRHTVARARTSLRKIMSNLVIDEARGLTALDLLSTTYKKASGVAKKSGKVALSLVLVFFAFLGFNLMPLGSIISQESIQNPNYVREPSISTVVVEPSANPADPKISDSPDSRKSPTRVENAKATNFAFAGLNKNGIPTGFTVSDSSGSLGSLYVSNRQPVLSETELIVSLISKTDKGAANIFLSQQFITDSYGFRYLPTVSYGKSGAWAPLVTVVSYLDSERQIDGNYLVTAVIKVQSEVDSGMVIPAASFGRDLLEAPRQIITRLILNPEKTQVLAQAVYVVEKTGKA